MSLTESDKKYILDQLLINIKGISDINYQKRVWIRGEGPEVDDFDETCIHFLEDTGWIFEDYKSFGLTNSQYHILKKFRDEFEAFSDENASMPMFWIDTPDWEQIREQAKEVLKAFNYKKNLK